jgi:hypothetical protein
VDTGATGHYLDQAAEKHCTNIKTTATGPAVRVANGETIHTTKSVIVPLAPELSTTAKVGHIFDRLQSGSLISIGQLCDDECVALFTKYNVKIIKDGKIIIIGARDSSNGLWNIPLAPKAQPLASTAPHVFQPIANSAIRDVKTKEDLSLFHHASAFSPTPSTYLWAVQRNHFNSFPGLTPALIMKHLAKSLATSKGHLRMQQKIFSQQKLSPPTCPSSLLLISTPRRSRISREPTPYSPPLSPPQIYRNPTPTRLENFPYNHPEATIM